MKGVFMKTKKVKRWIALTVDFTGERYFLQGEEMFPKFYKTRKDAKESSENKTITIPVMVDKDKV